MHSSPHDSSLASPQVLPSDWRVPEILAPAGGRAQFFAALQAGADAVFLGLKNFNARGRAENFTLEDLKELMPLARQERMKVLVTLNILLKDVELPVLIDELSELQWLGIEAVIIQDLGVAQLIKRSFPHLRMHASTQLAVHNRSGVLSAAALGFKRVVLARELTAQEIRRIRRDVPAELIEIEAFCHGSLCYSYSGLCFFSGAEDARSGNRGECAYTCRKPYQIVNEPGHGFLFSMKDLDTSLDLEKLVYAGVDTLKIEGRKKDAQYVATTVGLYRQQLDRIFGRSTGRAPTQHRRDYRRDMAFSFHRDTTTFFVKGRYHENVIDLANPTHKGLLIGTVQAVQGRSFEMEASEPLERYDGLRLESQASLYHAQPQHGETVKASRRATQQKYDNEARQFSLREFFVAGQKVHASEAGSRVRIQLPDDGPLPTLGDRVFKVRSNELKRFTETVAQAPTGSRLRPLQWFSLGFHLEPTDDGLLLIKAQAHLGSWQMAAASLLVPAERPQQTSRLERDLGELFHIFGAEQLEAEVSIRGDRNWFVPRSLLKQLKSNLGPQLREAVTRITEASRQAALEAVRGERHALAPIAAEASRFQLKIDRLEYLPALAKYLESHPDFSCDELIFEPKRAFLDTAELASSFANLFSFCARWQLRLRLALPTVMRAWDEPLLKAWVQHFIALGGRAFESGNVAYFSWFKELNIDKSDFDISSDFSLYALNSEAVAALAAFKLQRLALSIEDDATSLFDKLAHWPKSAGAPQVILFKDTPLFIAEACSLTALHHGCPGSNVCGYRTLEISNDEGERFFVAHETCKSIVYGAEALAWTQHRAALAARGVQDFRLDFLTRHYSDEHLHAVLDAARLGRVCAQTHSANFSRELL